MLEMVFNGVLALIFLFFIIGGANIPRLSRPADIVEAGGFPIVFGSIALILLIAETISQLKKLKKGERETEEAPLYGPGFVKLLIVLCMTVLYILLVKTVGFTILTVCYTFVALFILGSKKPVFNAIFAVAATLVLVLIFGRFFGISLPRGIGVIKNLSFYLY
ncbi:MAG: tripartite tricarboxylate transporter TctB family protein [Clostridiales bacterium]|nr:tripartite tricarboxylate transporter TctB family protein [Clostridiales bacterium]